MAIRRRTIEKTLPSRTLERLAGNELYVDPRGRSWRVRVFALREIGELWSMLLGASMFQLKQAPVLAKRVVWARVLVRCVAAAEDRPGLIVTARRALGLTDYSVRRMLRLVTVLPPPIVDVVAAANFDKRNFAELLEFETKREGGGGSSWDEVMASFVVNLHIPPGVLFGMTLPQMNALGEYSQREGREREGDRMLHDLKNRSGMVAR